MTVPRRTASDGVRQTLNISHCRAGTIRAAQRLLLGQHVWLDTLAYVSLAISREILNGALSLNTLIITRL